MFDKPSRRLRQEVDEDKHNNGGNELYSDRRPPLSLGLYKEEAVSDELPAGNAKRL